MLIGASGFSIKKRIVELDDAPEHFNPIPLSTHLP